MRALELTSQPIMGRKIWPNSISASMLNSNEFETSTMEDELI